MFGVLPILLTPFNEDGSIDWKSLENLTDLYQSANVDGITCLGEVSETDLLTGEERERIVKFCIDRFHGKPVVAGVSGNHDQMVQEAVNAEEMGATAILVPPYGNGDSAIYQHYMDMDSAVRVPIVLLDHPSSERPVMPVELIAKIAMNSENIKFLKIEDTPTALKMEKLEKSSRNLLTVYGASHGRYFYWELLRGAKGLMTSTPIPAMHVDIWNSFLSGDTRRAEELFYHSVPITFFMENIPVRVKKEVMVYMGIFRTSQMRKKGQFIPESGIKDLKNLVDWTLDYCRAKGIKI